MIDFNTLDGNHEEQDCRHLLIDCERSYLALRFVIPVNDTDSVLIADREGLDKITTGIICDRNIGGITYGFMKDFEQIIARFMIRFQMPPRKGDVFMYSPHYEYRVTKVVFADNDIIVTLIQC